MTHPPGVLFDVISLCVIIFCYRVYIYLSVACFRLVPQCDERCAHERSSEDPLSEQKFLVSADDGQHFSALSAADAAAQGGRRPQR